MLTNAMPLTHGHSLIESEATSDWNRPRGRDRNVPGTDSSWTMWLNSPALSPSTSCTCNESDFCSWVSRQHLLIFHLVTPKPFANGHYQLTRTHANPCFDSPVKNNHKHQLSSQPGNGFYEYATYPLKLRYSWNDPWDDGTKDASTKCGIQLWTPTTASYTCGSMDTYKCINATADIDFSTDLYVYFSTAHFPVDAFRYLDTYNVRFFTLIDMRR
jgi:hypothetical protein